METRANYVWVGVVTLLLLAGLAIFAVWLARLNAGRQQEYDIYFEQSVGGLSKGSQVSYSGVPVGQVSAIAIWPKDPKFVKVRITVNDETPVLLGTTASVSASFTGVSTISLNGGKRGAPEISCETTSCPEGVPVIPPQPGVLGEILASAPLLLERLATLTDRLTKLLSDENQASISGILANTDKMSAQLTQTAPQINQTMKELQGTLAQSTQTLAAFEDTLRSTDNLLNRDGASLAAELRQTLQSAQGAANAMATALNSTEPLTREMAEKTLPAAQATMEDLRRTSAALRAVTEKIENDGAGALMNGGRLPDYRP